MPAIENVHKCEWPWMAYIQLPTASRSPRHTIINCQAKDRDAGNTLDQIKPPYPYQASTHLSVLITPCMNPYLEVNINPRPECEAKSRTLANQQPSLHSSLRPPGPAFYPKRSYSPLPTRHLPALTLSCPPIRLIREDLPNWAVADILR